MKIEFEHQWQREHGVALRDRLIAFLPRLGRTPRVPRRC